MIRGTLVARSATRFMDIHYLAITAALTWAVILLLPWRPWATGEVLDASPNWKGDEDLSDITVLIPARDEADVIRSTLEGVKAQGGRIHVILVDDGSTDGTRAAAESVDMKGLQIISGEALPEGWSGKLWALEQGLRHVRTKRVLLLDADLLLKPGMIPLLRRKLEEDNRHLVSLMATLRMASFWEKMCMPAFVYFFKMLYPFRLSNSRFPWVAAAAGGCILVDAGVLKASGGFRAIRHELIDDCALARQIKLSGGRTWTGLSHSVCSLRPYVNLITIWNMVARTAFHQLRYSPFLLLLCSVIMIGVFWLPVSGAFCFSGLSRAVSLCALAAMCLSYLPILRFYGQSPGWSPLLPLIASLYLIMTWSSAIRFWRGSGMAWKDRSYSTMQ